MLRSMFLLLVVWALLLVVATSCATVPEGPEIDYNPDCATKIELRNGTKLEYPEDMDSLVRAEDGCIRHYGPGSCLTRFIKTGKLSYYAMCRRSQ